MMDAWLAFARTGDPSTPALPWPVYDRETRPTMVFGRESRRGGGAPRRGAAGRRGRAVRINPSLRGMRKAARGYADPMGPDTPFGSVSGIERGRRFEPKPRNVRAAREFVADELRDQGFEGDSESCSSWRASWSPTPSGTRPRRSRSRWTSTTTGAGRRHRRRRRPRPRDAAPRARRHQRPRAAAGRPARRGAGAATGSPATSRCGSPWRDRHCGVSARSSVA